MIAVVGFHRSLTSAIAQWLHRSGVSMGDYLMPPAPSNPEGHYEDMLLVNLHDCLLAAHGTNWQYHSEVSLDPFQGEELFRRYAELRRERHGRDWGMKDPRQCLFLPAWSRILGEEGRYLVVLRHWSGSIQSLLRRHASELAMGEDSPEVHSRFWRNPDCAADMWLSYNTRLLEFLEQCAAHQKLVVTQQAVLGGLQLPELLNERFGTAMNLTETPVKRSLTHDEVDVSVREGLSEDRIQQMDALWEALLSHAEHRVSDESPVWVSPAEDVSRKILSDTLLAASGDGPAISFDPPEVPRQAEYASGRSRLMEMDLNGAGEEFRSALRGNPRNPEFYVGLASLMLMRGLKEEAVALLKEGLDAAGDTTLLLHTYANALDQRGDTVAAIDFLKARDKLTEPLEKLLIALLMKTDYSTGRKQFSQWGRLKSQTPEAWQQARDTLSSVVDDRAREDLALRIADEWLRF